MSDLINMEKAGTVLEVHPTCVASHETQGWTKTAAKPTEDANVNDDDIKELREEYRILAGKKAGPNWTVETLTEKIAALTDPDNKD